MVNETSSSVGQLVRQRRGTRGRKGGRERGGRGGGGTEPGKEGGRQAGRERGRQGGREGGREEGGREGRGVEMSLKRFTHTNHVTITAAFRILS